MARRHRRNQLDPAGVEVMTVLVEKRGFKHGWDGCCRDPLATCARYRQKVVGTEVIKPGLALVRR